MIGSRDKAAAAIVADKPGPAGRGDPPRRAAAAPAAGRGGALGGRWLSLSWAAAIAAIVVGALMPAALPEGIIVAFTVILFNCYLAQCWNLAAGYAGQFSLGHGVFLAVGAYTSTVLFTKFGISPWLGMIAGAALAAVLGAAIAAISFRYGVRGVFFAVVTLSSVEVTRALVGGWDFVGGTSGIFIVLADQPWNMMFDSRTPYFELILAMVVLLAFGTRALERSRFGQYLMALREDEDAAEASGVPTFECKVGIIALSAAATALAGSFYAQFLLFIVPEAMFSFDHILTMMLGTIVGGSGTVMGPIVGTVLFGGLSEVLRTLPIVDSREVASLIRIAYGVALMVIVLRMPLGIVGLVSRRWGRR
jgi:branched-chain amino acid transport system permease protein